ncbi:MAG: hypothetical protein AAF628_26815 [Planctomycetota bacterium]
MSQERRTQSNATDLASHFDLISETSTGAILAIGLALQIAPTELLKFYSDDGPHIFRPGGEIRHWLTSKYEMRQLAERLHFRYGIDGRRCVLADARTRLVIPDHPGRDR